MFFGKGIYSGILHFTTFENIKGEGLMKPDWFPSGPQDNKLSPYK
jgi:hypothetical protein